MTDETFTVKVNPAPEPVTVGPPELHRAPSLPSADDCEQMAAALRRARQHKANRFDTTKCAAIAKVEQALEELAPLLDK